MASGGQGESWRTQEFRQKVMGQIEEAVRMAGNPTSKTSIEMEAHVFQKAKSREEYLALVARLIIHVREINSKKEKAAAAAMGGMPGQGMPPGMAGQGSMQDPINALQNLTKAGLTGPMQQQQQQMPQGHMGMHPTMQQPMQPGMPQGMQPGMQQGLPPGLQQGLPPGMQPQQGMPPGMQQGINPAMQQGIQQRPPFTAYQQQPMMSRPPHPQQGVRPESFMQQQPASGPASMQAGPSNMPSPAMASVPQNYEILVENPMRLNLSGHGAMGQMQSSPYSAQGHSPFPQQTSQVPGPSPVAQPVPSPATSSSQSILSPAGLMPISSPQSAPQTIAHSPASRALIGGAPSPGSALNTPGNPGSNASPNPNPTPASSVRKPAEEQAYMEKLKQLSKYIEPLRRMINKIDKDEGNTDRTQDLSKMKSLLDILSDSSQRLSMATLEKCEHVLKKLEFKAMGGSTGFPAVSVPSTVSTTSQHICQPLLDAVAAHIKSPLINHTLQRTFGPAISALHGPPIVSPSPPPKKRKHDDDSDPEISHVLQGEIARLQHRFRVSLDPLHHTGSSTVQLICRIDDENLPNVPSIVVSIPEKYPYCSPTCNTDSDDYEATPFFQNCQKILHNRLQKMPDLYSLTALLNTWEMSIRQACSPGAPK